MVGFGASEVNLLATLLLALGIAHAGEGPSWQREGWGFGGIPAVNFNTDEGLGLGALASIYRYDGETSPYKFSSTFLIFATTRGVHSHRIDFDALKLAKGRLRLSGRVQSDITRSNPFCGVGRSADCDQAEAESAADTLGLEGDERDTFVRRYYLYSYIRPNLNLTGRYRVGDLDRDMKQEVFGSLRTMYFQPGDFNARIPDPGSAYSQYVGEGADLDKEQGWLSVVQLGVMADTRDFESSPSSGYWVEASARGAHGMIGSGFEYVGINTTGRFYFPILPEGRLVSANRVAFDAMTGDVPLREMAEMGGSQIYNFGGGLNAGRGIRQRRYVGRVKGLVQPEVRWRFLSVDSIGLDLSLLAFADMLFVARDWDSLGDLGRPAVGQGGGLRIAFDDNFIIRADVGFSAEEEYSPSVYIDINNLF